ncbi:MAG: hypothetical protein NZ554_03425 [Bryobacteraceae bacterium]|nr:hypothetical protein [Bryobacteraceae bacterium]
MEAISARGLTGKIVLVGFDATREVVRAVQAGLLQATVAGHPERMDRRTIEEPIKAARGLPVEKHVDVGTALVTMENAGEYLR